MSYQRSFSFSSGPEGFDALDVTGSNRAAVSLLRSADPWPYAALCLVGPPRCGLSTLARVWTSSGAARLYGPEEIEAIAPAALSGLAAGRLAVDPGDGFTDEARLLFLINTVAREGGELLLTGHTPPGAWPAANRDLRSRLDALPVVEIEPPDDEMVEARLASLLARQYYRLPDELAAFLRLRLEPTYADIEECVKRLVSAAGAGQDLTVPLGREVIGGMYGEGPQQTDGDGDE